MSIRQLVGILVLLGGAQVMAQTAPADGLTLQQALQTAGDNLEVALARSALAAARADILSADRAPLPSLIAKFGQMDLQNGIGEGNFVTNKRVDKSVGLDWTWERGNKRELRTRGAQRTAAAAQADLDEVRIQQQLAVHASFFDLLAAQERVEQVQLIARSAAELAAAAQKRLSAGDISSQDASRTDIEAQRARSDIQLAQLERERAALALWQSTGIQTPPGQLKVVASWPSHAAATRAAPDYQALVESRADVLAAQSRLQAAQAQLDSSQALRYRDITWGASYDHYPGTSTALLELRMQMPLQWGYSYQGEIARASAQLTQAQDALEKTRRVAQTELQRLWQELQASGERARTYERDILPQARKVAQGAELAYGKGALTLTDLIDARRTLRNTVLEAISAQADHARATGAWRLRTQGDFFAATP